MSRRIVSEYESLVTPFDYVLTSLPPVNLQECGTSSMVCQLVASSTYRV